MRLQRNCRKQAIAVRREKALVHSGKKTRPEAGSPHPMAIGAVVGAQCLTLGACDGSRRIKGSAARHHDSIRHDSELATCARRGTVQDLHSPTASEGCTNLTYQLFDCHRQAAIVDRFLKE